MFGVSPVDVASTGGRTRAGVKKAALMFYSNPPWDPHRAFADLHALWNPFIAGAGVPPLTPFTQSTSPITSTSTSPPLSPRSRALPLPDIDIHTQSHKHTAVFQHAAAVHKLQQHAPGQMLLSYHTANSLINKPTVVPPTNSSIPSSPTNVKHIASGARSAGLIASSVPSSPSALSNTTTTTTTATAIPSFVRPAYPSQSVSISPFSSSSCSNPSSRSASPAPTPIPSLISPSGRSASPSIAALANRFESTTVSVSGPQTSPRTQARTIIANAQAMRRTPSPTTNTNGIPPGPGKPVAMVRTVSSPAAITRPTLNGTASGSSSPFTSSSLSPAASPRHNGAGPPPARSPVPPPAASASAYASASNPFSRVPTAAAAIVSPKSSPRGPSHRTVSSYAVTEQRTPAKQASRRRSPSSSALSSDDDDACSLLGIEIAVALHDYKAKRDVEVSFSKGDELIVVARDVSGWWTGMLKHNGATGLFPSNYTRPKENK